MPIPLFLPPLAVSTGESHDAAAILVALFVIFASAKAAGSLFNRIGQPAVVGEILVGILLGPSVLGWITPSEPLTVLAELGVIFLLFTVGLETKPRSIIAVGPQALAVAVIGVVLPLLAGWFLGIQWGLAQVEALFLGATMVATSVGITASVLNDMGLLACRPSRIILGAAIIDDILALLVLSVLSSMAAGSIDYVELGTTTLLAIAFTGFIATLGPQIVRKVSPGLKKLKLGQSIFAGGLVLCLGFAVLAQVIGIAAIVGAFLAGMMLSETAENTSMTERAEAVSEFFVPFFLVNIGLQLDIQTFLQPSILALSAIALVLAVVTKLAGGLGVFVGRKPDKDAVREFFQVGTGMIPRGEVGLIVAQIGSGLGVLSAGVYGAALAVAVGTTIVAPPLLKIAFTGQGSDGQAPAAEPGDPIG